MMHWMNTRAFSVIFWILAGVFIASELQEGLYVLHFSNCLDESTNTTCSGFYKENDHRYKGINATSSTYHKENEILFEASLQEDEDENEYDFDVEYDFEWVYLPSDEDHVENMALSEVEDTTPEVAGNSTYQQPSFSIDVPPGNYHVELSDNGDFAIASTNTTN